MKVKLRTEIRVTDGDKLVGLICSKGTGFFLYTETGEGMQLSQEDLYKLLRKYFEENF